MWLLDVLRIKDVIMLVGSLNHGKKLFHFGYKRALRNKLGAIAVFTESSPDSTFCLLSLS